MSTTTTPTLPGARAETELGYLAPRAVDVFWPDEDGEIEVGHRYFEVTNGVPSAELFDAVKADGGRLVQRTVTRGATELVPLPAPPLPTAKGSVVRAHTGDPAEERLFFSYGVGDYWVADRPVSGAPDVARAERLTVVDVILDASTL